MLQGVTQRGTAGALAVLGRPIMGKTGTTNDSKDNWFMGSTPDITIGIYIGFDEPRTLGPTNMETGGGNAVPIYKHIADVVFKDKPPMPFKVPPGLRMIRWSYEGGTIDEVFKPGTEPGGELAAGTSHRRQRADHGRRRQRLALRRRWSGPADAHRHGETY